MTEISIQRRFLAGRDESQRGLVVETTLLKGTCMFWVGPCGSEEEMESAVEQGRLARDWACAMPPLANGEASGTSLFRNAANDAALSMAMRLARRLQKQVFVGLDVEGLEAVRAERAIISEQVNRV